MRPIICSYPLMEITKNYFTCLNPAGVGIVAVNLFADGGSEPTRCLAGVASSSAKV